MSYIDTSFIQNGSSIENASFFSMDHPFFYFLSLFVIGIVTYLFNLKQKRNENIYEAKKEILKKRIEIYNELYNLTSLASQIIPIKNAAFGINIFKGIKKLDEWSNQFSIFYSKNWMYFTIESKIAIQIVRRFQQNYFPVKNKFSDEDLLQFSYDYFEDWVFITDELRNSIEDFFNNKIDFKQKFLDLTDKENEIANRKCSNLKMLRKLIEMK